MKEQRTLCHRCAAAYRDAGYYIRRDYNATVKDACDICGRMGWTYLLERKRDGKDGYKPT